MQAASRLKSSILHVRWEIFRFQTAWTGSRPRPVVRVIQPAALRVPQIGRLVYFQQALVFSGRIAPIHRSRPVEGRISPRNVVAVEISDITLRGSKQGVVRGVGEEFHGLFVRLVISSLGSQIRLLQGLHGLLHASEAHPLAVLLANHWPMLRSV